MTTSTNSSQPARSTGELANMSPTYFGLVMATGIISLAAFMLGHHALASGLFYLNIGQYGLLWVLYGLRAWRYPRRFFCDMIAHLTGSSYFTAVAGTGILASQFMVLRDNYVAGGALWLLAMPTLDKGHQWRLVAGRRGYAGPVGVQRTAGCAQWPALPAGTQLHRAIHLAVVGWYALRLDDGVDLLPIRLLPLLARRFDAALLDQYGGNGDLDPGRLPADPQRTARPLSRLVAALPEGVHHPLLGDRHMVDSHAACAGGLAPHL